MPITRTEKLTKGCLWSPAAGFASPKRINAKMLVTFEGTGAAIAALSASDLNNGDIVFCSTTGSGFTAGKYYGRDETNTTWVQRLLSYRETFTKYLPENAFWFSKPCFSNQKSGGMVSTSGASTVTDETDTGAVRMKTGLVSGVYADIGWEGFLISFAEAITANFKFNADSNNNVRMRIGIGVDDIRTDIVSTNNQFGLSTNILTPGGSMGLISADQDNWSKTQSGISPHLAGNEMIGFDFQPDEYVRVYKNGKLDTTKTSDVPYAGTNSGNRILYAGVATREDDRSKSIVLYGFEITGKKGEVFGPT